MVDEPDYRVLRTVEKAELRRYPMLILATVKGHTSRDAFDILFRYISGNNTARSKIPMTAPVIDTEQHWEKIPMTAPVVFDSNSMSFVMPASYTSTTVPQPKDQRVEMEEIPERTLAVLRFKGRANKSLVEAKIKELREILTREGISMIGAPTLMQYNPPYTPRFLRRNEVGIEISE